MRAGSRAATAGARFSESCGFGKGGLGVEHIENAFVYKLSKLQMLQKYRVGTRPCPVPLELEGLPIA